MSAEIDPALIALGKAEYLSWFFPDLPRVATLGDLWERIGELVRERDAALGFSGVILKAARDHIGCDVDGGDVQDAAAKYGLLEKVLVSEPCGEYCVCQEYGFPTDCYPFTALGKLALKKAADE